MLVLRIKYRLPMFSRVHLFDVSQNRTPCKVIGMCVIIFFLQTGRKRNHKNKKKIFLSRERDSKHTECLTVTSKIMQWIVMTVSPIQ